MIPLFLALLLQDEPKITQDAGRILQGIESGDQPGAALLVLFEDYAPTLEWEEGLVPLLIETLRTGSHSLRFNADRVFPKVTGIDLGGFEGHPDADQKSTLAQLDRWWATYKDRMRVDWFIDALSSRNLGTRQMAIDNLTTLFGKSFGYEPEGKERDEAAAEWKTWWEKNRAGCSWDAERELWFVKDEKLAESDAKVLRERIAAWIEDLAAPDLETRERATQRLIEAGRATHDALREAVKSDDLEVRDRARWILAAETVITRRKALAGKVAAVLGSSDPALEVRWLAERIDLESALILVDVCTADGSLARIAASRAATDPQIAWVWARKMRRLRAEGSRNAGGCSAPDGVKALFARDAARLLPYLKDPSPAVRMSAGALIAGYGLRYLDAVKPLLGDADRRVRLATLQGLGLSGDPTVSPVLLRHCSSEEDWDNRRWTLIAVGRLKGASALEALSPIAEDAREHIFVSGAAVEAMGMIGSPKASPLLQKIYQTRLADLKTRKDDYGRRYVLSYVALSALRIAVAHPDEADAWALVESMLAHESRHVRLVAVWAINGLDPEEGKASTARLHRLLQGLEEETDAEIRQHVESGLRRWSP